MTSYQIKTLLPLKDILWIRLLFASFRNFVVDLCTYVQVLDLKILDNGRWIWDKLAKNSSQNYLDSRNPIVKDLLITKLENYLFTQSIEPLVAVSTKSAKNARKVV